MPSLTGDAKVWTYLVEEVLYQMGDADIVQVSVGQQQFLEVLKLRNGVVTVPHSLPTLFPLNS